MQFEKALTLFADHLRDERTSVRTIEAYVGSVRRILSGCAAWNSPKAEEFLLEWRRGMQRQYAAREISDSGIRVAVAALRRFYSWCVMIGLLPTSPAENLASVAAENRLPRPMPVEDVRKLLDAIPADATRDRAAIELFLNGLRNVEVCRMNFGWLSVVPSETTICARVVGKGDVVGDVMLSPSCANALGIYVTMRLAGLGWRDYIASADTLLEGVDRCLRQYPGARDKPVFEFNGHRPTRQNLNDMFREYRNKAGLSNSYGPHSLRHTCGTELIEQGVDVRVVQEILRHSNIAQTVRYTQIRRGPKAAAMRRLPNFGGTVAV